MIAVSHECVLRYADWLDGRMKLVSKWVCKSSWAAYSITLERNVRFDNGL